MKRISKHAFCRERPHFSREPGNPDDGTLQYQPADAAVSAARLGQSPLSGERAEWVAALQDGPATLKLIDGCAVSRCNLPRVNLITLTTDFGTRDWFVGTMKGVILGIQPHVRIVDITHDISAGDIRAGAFALAASCRYFPRGTIHVAVVDPGVGSQRRAIAVQTAHYFFVGPDNGVLSFALAREKIKTIRRLENDKYFLRPVSNTFHGRDVFAPVAAHLNKGLNIRKVGPAMKEFAPLPCPSPVVRRGEIHGAVIYIDRFGNAITNISNDKVAKGRWQVCVGRRPICSVEPFYQSVRTGSPVAVAGSSGFLEIAVNGGHAARRFALRPGSVISAQRE